MVGVALASPLKHRLLDATAAGASVGQTVELSAQTTHYARDVLRLQIGEDVELFDGAGARWHVRVASHEPFRVDIVAPLPVEAANGCRVTLHQALIKGDRFDWVLEKTTELGVCAIVAMQTARTVVRIPAERQSKRRARWTKIVESATRQSGRVDVPTVGGPTALHELIANAADAAHVVFDPSSHTSLRSILDGVGAEHVVVWIGPEGGFDDDELAMLSRLATPCSLGPQTLRADTAAIVGVALVQAFVGGLEQ